MMSEGLPAYFTNPNPEPEAEPEASSESYKETDFGNNFGGRIVCYWDTDDKYVGGEITSRARVGKLPTDIRSQLKKKTSKQAYAYCVKWKDIGEEWMLTPQMKQFKTNYESNQKYA